MTLDQAVRRADRGRTLGVRELPPLPARAREPRLPVGLAWCSIAVGVTQLVAPDLLARLLGVRPSHASRAAMRTVGSALILAGGTTLNRSATARQSPSGGDAVDAILSPTPRDRRSLTAGAANGARKNTAPRSAGTREGVDSSSGSVEIAQPEMRTVQHAVTILRPASELYAFWRDFGNLASFMAQLESVTCVDDVLLHWVTRAPGGSRRSWDAEIVADVPGELIAWQSLPDADIHSAATVRFMPTASGTGAIVHLILEYSPTVGSLGEVVARMFRVEPAQQLAADLEAFRRLMESGAGNDDPTCDARR